MHSNSSTVPGKVFVPILFLSIAILLCLADRAPMHLASRIGDDPIGKEFRSFLDGVIDRTLPGPYPYRILVPLVVAGSQKLLAVANPITVDFLLKVAILFFCQYSLHRYLRNFLGHVQAIAGVFWFDTLVGFSLSYLQGPSVLETIDLANTLVFVLALDAIYKNRFVLFSCLILVGISNRESILLLLPVLLLTDRSSGRGFTRSFVLAAAALLCLWGLRTLIDARAYAWVTFEGIAISVPWLLQEHTSHALAGNFHLLMLLGPLLFFSVVRFKRQHQFLKLTMCITPVYIILQYLFGTIIEARNWIPLFVVLIPVALSTMEEMLVSSSNPRPFAS